MTSKYLVHAEHSDPANSMIIECSDVAEMVQYANECRRQGYTVKTEVRHEEEPKPLHGNVIS